MRILISLELDEGTTWEQVQKSIAVNVPSNTKLDVVPVTNLVDSYGAKGVITVVDETAALNYFSYKNTW